MKKIGKLFPSLNTTVAYYDPGTFFINLNNISEERLLALKGKMPTAENVEDIKTINHEIRHNIDHIATLWGQKNILKYIRALNARLGTDIKKYNSIIDYKLEDNQLFYANYYTEEYSYFPVAQMDKRWKWRATSGLKFDSKGNSDESQPISMIHFRTFDDKPLIRIPLSIAALLETNAIAEEITLHLGYISSMSEVERPFHIKFFENETLLNIVYNQDLAVYNVAVHLTANLLELTDIIEAFEISKTIATLSLNLPSSLVSKLKIDNDQFKDWGHRSQAMLDNHDYGFIFFTLLSNYKSIYKEKKEFDINDVIISSNLPDYAEIEKILFNELEAIEDEIKTFVNFKEIFLPKITKGKEMLKSLGLAFEKMTIYEASIKHLFAPIIICNDTLINEKTYRAFEISQMQPIKQLDKSEWYNITWVLNQKLTEFYEVRGI